jgi:hypothetical protein
VVIDPSHQPRILFPETGLHTEPFIWYENRSTVAGDPDSQRADPQSALYQRLIQKTMPILMRADVFFF